MSFTSPCSAPCSPPIHSISAHTCTATRWSTSTAIPCPPAASTSAAGSSIVSGRFISERAARVVCPVAYTGAPAAPSGIAMPRPAPRVAPATSAALSANGFAIAPCVVCPGRRGRPVAAPGTVARGRRHR